MTLVTRGSIGGFRESLFRLSERQRHEKPRERAALRSIPRDEERGENVESDSSIPPCAWAMTSGWIAPLDWRRARESNGHLLPPFRYPSRRTFA
jgi:hypothetical protein